MMLYTQFLYICYVRVHRQETAITVPGNTYCVIGLWLTFLDKADYDLGDYPPLDPAAFLARNPVPPAPPFPYQNLRSLHDNEDDDDKLPSRLDMRLNKLLDSSRLQLPTFGLHSPDMFDLQPQLGFGLADFRSAVPNLRPTGPEAAAEMSGQQPEDKVAPVLPAASGPFPRLTMKQRQFAVSPELPEFFQEHPDFLGEENKICIETLFTFKCTFFNVIIF